jgi:hypothetical protein
MNARRRFLPLLLALAACSTNPKDDDTAGGGFSDGSTDSGADGSADGPADGGGDGAAEGTLAGDFIYSFEYGADGACRRPATVAGDRADLSCPTCDFELERVYVVEFSLGAPFDEGICAETGMFAYMEATDEEVLNYQAGIWGFGNSGGEDVLVLGYNYGYGDGSTFYYDIRMVDGSGWDRSSGAFEFNIRVTGVDAPYYEGDPSVADPDVVVAVSGSAR